MLRLIRENRLKLVSVFAVMADFTVAMAGGASFLSADNLDSTGSFFLFIGGVFGLIGHAVLLLWGKGGKLAHTIKAAATHSHVLLRPLKPWHYPLDFSFATWFTGSICYIVSGFFSGNIGILVMGCFTGSAALVGWLWPQDKPILWMRSMQLCALLYSGASFSGFAAAYIAKDPILFAAMCMYLTCNVILSTVRKENQSAHTQNVGI